MKSRGILFSAPMIQPLLADVKTQTRRLIQPQPQRVDEHMMPLADGGVSMCVTVPAGWRWKSLYTADGHGFADALASHSPYGSRGDRLWVREAWRTVESLDELSPSQLAESVPVRYECDGAIRGRCRELVGRYRHARFMPRWGSRIELEIAEIRVQPLQDITDDDARAEGVEKFFARFPQAGRDQRITDGRYARDEEYRASYACLWDEINGDTALWNTNPWVWAITFKRVEAVP